MSSEKGMQISKIFVCLQTYFSFFTLCNGNYQNVVQLGSWDRDHFHFGNCNKSQVPLYIRNFTLATNPVQLGYPAEGTISFDVTEDIGEYLQAELSIRLKTPFGYTEVCELVGTRYCYVEDACFYIKRFKWCPPFFRHGDECKCPLKKGKYDNVFYSWKTDKLPFELNGTFDVSLEMYDKNRLIACIDVHFCISKCMH